jgi:hypothetical protein
VQAYVAAAWLLAVSGVVVLAIGIYRFRAVTATLRSKSVGRHPG